MKRREFLKTAALGAGATLTGAPLPRVVGAENSNASCDAILVEAKTFPLQGQTEGLEPKVLDFRYQPGRWQACYGLVDGLHKSMVDSYGQLYYDFRKGDHHTCILASLDAQGTTSKPRQSLLDPRIPIVITEQDTDNLVLHQELWANAPEGESIKQWAPHRIDYLWLKMKNRGVQAEKGRIVLTVELDFELVLNEDKTCLVKKDKPEETFCTLGGASGVSLKSEWIDRDDWPVLRSGHISEKRKSEKWKKFSHELAFQEKTLAPGEEFRVLLGFYQGELASAMTTEKDAAGERARAIKYWNEVDLPYDRMTVPDTAVQGLLDSCIRNIYQAREIKEGLPAFQVGPTCFRGTWAVDGAFITEAIAYLGRAAEARGGLEHQVDQDQGPGGIAFSKKAGIRLWMIWRHAQLTGDWAWLEKMWPRVERDARQIAKYRQMTRKDPNQANYGLMPIGTGDGGLGGMHREYTNVYWTLAGLRAAIEMAEKMNKPALLSAWKAEYQDYWKAFDKARNRDKLVDSAGNVYVPVTMKGEEEQTPQRGAWAFMQSIFPGRIFAPDDELMRGTLAMLDANVREGLIYGTGWMPKGIWNYAGSFYGHAHLWLGHGKKTAATFYAFANHASPLLFWQEEQRPVGEPYFYDGDMPHNWGSAEFIRMVRHMLILERDKELHLLEGLPSAWTSPGSNVRMVEIPTAYGPMSLSLRASEDGKSATIEVDPQRYEPPEKIVVHLEHLGRPVKETKLGNIELTDAGVKIQADGRLTLRVAFEKQ